MSRLCAREGLGPRVPTAAHLHGWTRQVMLGEKRLIAALLPRCPCPTAALPGAPPPGGDGSSLPDTTREAFQIFSGHLRRAPGPAAIADSWGPGQYPRRCQCDGGTGAHPAPPGTSTVLSLIETWSTWPFMHLLGTDGQVWSTQVEYPAMLPRPFLERLPEDAALRQHGKCGLALAASMKRTAATVGLHSVPSRGQRYSQTSCGETMVTGKMRSSTAACKS